MLGAASELSCWPPLQASGLMYCVSDQLGTILFVLYNPLHSSSSICCKVYNIHSLAFQILQYEFWGLACNVVNLVLIEGFQMY